MSKKIFFTSLIFILILSCFLFGEIKKLLVIGSNEPNYLFMAISGVALDENKNVYICDSGGAFLRKYDSKGNFIKEIGRQGQGPGEFSNSIGPLCCDSQGLYLLDALNHRIAVFDKELNVKNYVKLEGIKLSLSKIGDYFYLLAKKPGEPFMQIEIYNQDGQLVSSFFDQRPPFLKNKNFSKQEYPIWMRYSGICLATDPILKELAVTFQYPGDKVELFFYTEKGQFKNKIELNHIVDYKFPEFLLKVPSNYPNRSSLVFIKSIHYLGQKHILLEYWLVNYESNKVKEEKHYLLVVDRGSGKIIHQEKISDISLTVMNIKDDFICASEVDKDIPKVALYKISY